MPRGTKRYKFAITDILLKTSRKLWNHRVFEHHILTNIQIELSE